MSYPTVILIVTFLKEEKFTFYKAVPYQPFPITICIKATLGAAQEGTETPQGTFSKHMWAPLAPRKVALPLCLLPPLHDLSLGDPSCTLHSASQQGFHWSGQVLIFAFFLSLSRILDITESCNSKKPSLDFNNVILSYINRNHKKKSRLLILDDIKIALY